MNLKALYVIVNYDIPTGEMVGVSESAFRQTPMTMEEAQRICDSLNPARGIRHRVGLLLVREEKP